MENAYSSVLFSHTSYNPMTCGWSINFMITTSRSIPTGSALLIVRGDSCLFFVIILTAASFPVVACFASLTRPLAPFPSVLPSRHGPTCVLHGRLRSLSWAGFSSAMLRAGVFEKDQNEDEKVADFSKSISRVSCVGQITEECSSEEGVTTIHTFSVQMYTVLFRLGPKRLLKFPWRPLWRPITVAAWLSDFHGTDVLQNLFKYTWAETECHPWIGAYKIRSRPHKKRKSTARGLSKSLSNFCLVRSYGPSLQAIKSWHDIRCQQRLSSKPSAVIQISP